MDIESIAAITFTEKAAAELRHRLRAELASADGRQAGAGRARPGAIGTLHAFARRLLFEFPIEAGLPPGFTVLDELESQLALDERWEDLLDELLDEASRTVAPGLTAAELMQLCDWASFGGTAGCGGSARTSRPTGTSWRIGWSSIRPPAPAASNAAGPDALGSSVAHADACGRRPGEVARPSSPRSPTSCHGPAPRRHARGLER